MPRKRDETRNPDLGFERTLFRAAEKLRSDMEAARRFCSWMPIRNTCREKRKLTDAAELSWIPVLDLDAEKVTAQRSKMVVCFD